MRIVTNTNARSRLSRLIEDAAAGEEIVIARGKTPVARLVPIAQGGRFGALRGNITVTEAFFEPRPPDEPDAWES